MDLLRRQQNAAAYVAVQAVVLGVSWALEYHWSLLGVTESLTPLRVFAAFRMQLAYRKLFAFTRNGAVPSSSRQRMSSHRHQPLSAACLPRDFACDSDDSILHVLPRHHGYEGGFDGRDMYETILCAVV